jgi:hypothetical protein
MTSSPHSPDSVRAPTLRLYRSMPSRAALRADVRSHIAPTIVGSLGGDTRSAGPFCMELLMAMALSLAPERQGVKQRSAGCHWLRRTWRSTRPGLYTFTGRTSRRTAPARRRDVLEDYYSICRSQSDVMSVLLGLRELSSGFVRRGALHCVVAETGVSDVREHRLNG